MTKRHDNWERNGSESDCEQPEKFSDVRQQIGKRMQFLFTPVDSQSIDQQAKESGLSKNLVRSWKEGADWLPDDNVGKLKDPKFSDTHQSNHESTDSTPQPARFEQNTPNSAVLMHDRMEFENYLTIIWRRKFVILITVVVTMLVLLAGKIFYPTPYESVATLRVSPSRDAEVTYEEMLYVDRLLRTYTRVAASSSMEKEVARRLGLSESPTIKAEVLPNTELIQISVEDKDPDIAQSAVDLLVEMLVGQGEQLGSRYNPLTVIEQSSTNHKSFLSTPLSLLLGMFMGLIGGIGLAFLLENLDRKLYKNRQIETVSNLPTLGKIPKVGREETRMNADQCSRQLTQSFHILRGNILLRSNGNPLKSIMVVSADPREGKSTVIANLACSMTQAGRKAVIIDGDLRRPKQHEIFKVANDVGLSDYLNNRLDLEEVLQTAESGIDVIASGPLPPDPISLLRHEAVSALISDLAERYDHILVDAPAILAVPDAKWFAYHVDGLILVVNRPTITREAVQLAIESLGDMHAQTIGIVINRAEFKDGYYYYAR